MNHRFQLRRCDLGYGVWDTEEERFVFKSILKRDAVAEPQARNGFKPVDQGPVLPVTGTRERRSATPNRFEPPATNGSSDDHQAMATITAIADKARPAYGIHHCRRWRSVAPRTTPVSLSAAAAVRRSEWRGSIGGRSGQSTDPVAFRAR